MTNKKRGIILIALGALLLTAAVSLVIYNRCRDSEAGKEAEKTVSVIKAYIETESARNSSDTAPDMQPVGDPILAVAFERNTDHDAHMVLEYYPYDTYHYLAVFNGRKNQLVDCYALDTVLTELAGFLN